MKKHSKISPILIILGAFLLSCNTTNFIQTPLVEDIQLTSTTQVAITPSLTVTPSPIFPEFATLEVMGTLCTEAKDIHSVEISPNGKWIAATCYWENGKEESPLQVSSIDRSQDWKIYFSDYIFSVYQDKIGLSLDRHDEVRPYRWSTDGKFLFATVGSRLDGCCWIGGRNILLVRLNLETGEQIALLRTDYYSANTFDFIISDNDRYLLFSSPSNQSYDFAVLDFQTWETQEVFLEFEKDIDVAYAIMSPGEDEVILPLFKNLEFSDYYVDSIALVDLITGKQDILISDLTPEDELFPIRWTDISHVLLSNISPLYNAGNQKEIYWLLDIRSGQLEEETP